ncbi:hypothetical protein L210DRAFT_3650107 [Boletus edulis BED1]|uniref:Uncharacterized protein n=2 Tax=Boletus edulis BED1 TaxID=1328754 RepID=A0AAD4BKX4_BOLED|nr:hypothetical protein L210DRAFT_3650107 [Boletus edulis BED1]
MAGQLRTSGKRRSNRGWWWDHFIEHPGYATKEPASMASGKAKCIAREQQIDQNQISTGQRDSPRDQSAITGTLWATGQTDTQRIWLISRPTTLLCHLRDCELHPDDVRSRAQRDYHESYSPQKGTRQQTIVYPHGAGPAVMPVKQRLKRQYADIIEEKSGAAESESVPSGDCDHQRESESRDDVASQEHEGTSSITNDSPTQSHGIREVAQSLIQAVDEEEQTQNSMASPQYSQIPIKTLLDYSESHAESWLGSFYKTAARCLDDDLELYQLLDLDAEGINDPDHSQVEDMLAE